MEQIEVPLEFGSKFFRNLQQEVKSLEDLQEKEQKLLTDQIAGLSKAVTALSKPSKFRKTDMNRWREVFEIYLQASVFFSTNELDHGYRTAEEAAAKVRTSATFVTNVDYLEFPTWDYPIASKS